MSAIGNVFRGLAAPFGGLLTSGNNMAGGPSFLSGLTGGLMGLGNGSAGNGGLLGGFDGAMQAELQNMLAQELRQMRENRQMDELKHKGKLHSDAGQIAQ